MARLDKLTVKAREALQQAQELAGTRSQQEVQPEHILTALLQQEGGIVSGLLRKLGVDAAAVQRNLERAIDALPKVQGAVDLYFGRNGKQLLDQAGKEADALKDEYISSEHFLLAAAHKDVGPASVVLREAGIDYESLLRAMTEVRGTQRVTDENPEEKYQALERY